MTSIKSAVKTVIIGIGHPDRGDDALGSLVIERFRMRSFQQVELLTLIGDMSELFEYFSAFSNVILVDALQTQSHSVGTCLRFSIEDIPKMLYSKPSSTHSFDLSQTLKMAQNLDLLPPSLAVFGIEALTFEQGLGLTKAVLNAIPSLEEMILSELTHFHGSL